MPPMAETAMVMVNRISAGENVPLMTTTIFNKYSQISVIKKSQIKKMGSAAARLQVSPRHTAAAITHAGAT